MDRCIDDVRETHFFPDSFMERRADTVHDHDRIIDRVSEDREESREEKCVDLELWKKE